MNWLDYAVLLGLMLGIAVYGMWRTRGRRNLHSYLKGAGQTHWLVIGLSVMATQASAVTFMSTPGQGYADGLGFVQFYFGVPLALVIIAAAFMPIYRKLNVYTAYEFLGSRFDAKTRLLGAGLFLIQRGLGAGLTIYAPAIILSSVLGWPLHVTIIFSGAVVVIYTAFGGCDAVSHTQKWQLTVIFGGMAAALGVLLAKLPRDVSFSDAMAVAGGFGKLHAVSFSLDPHTRYTLWSGLLGGLFLQLSYFGTDQSQVQRYLSGSSLREGRLGLMFNALCKIPMQFLVLLVGVLVFVYYQFQPPPLVFNRPAWAGVVSEQPDQRRLEDAFAADHQRKRQFITQWLDARRIGDARAEALARDQAVAAQDAGDGVRRQALLMVRARTAANDNDYVFITFILDHLPHGIIGLLIAAFFGAALSSKAAELNALGACTTVDFYRHLIRRDAPDAHCLAASRWFTVLWGVIAIGFALFANLSENLIQAVNIVGSIFYGVMLGLFLAGFFLRRIGGTAIFVAALASQALVFVLYFSLSISYLWLIPIGCGACVAGGWVLQLFLGRRGAQA